MIVKKAVSLFLLLIVAAIAAAQKPEAPHTNLKVGDPAPDFTLPSTIVGPDSKTVRYKLSDFKGKKNVVLAFYVLAFTGG
jgi:cytochrome oxidase Cu insertion factor (SCO1/SenC/PrrC family)